jgi:hypothetical protein
MASTVLLFDSTPPHPALWFLVTLNRALSHPLVRMVPAGAVTVTVLSEVSPPVAEVLNWNSYSTAAAPDTEEDGTGDVSSDTLVFPGVMV